MRENLQDENADQLSEALFSNIYILDVETGVLNQVTNFDNGYVETPLWSHDGNTLAFNVVVNGRINVSIVDVGQVGVGSSDPVEISPLETESTCCPAWMRK
jgi:Tol biopolymer transport system component